MKTRNIFFGLFIMLLPSLAYSQGLEGIVVEKYYSTNAADAANATAEGAVTPLVAGSTVYRVYVDMAPGYKFSTLYGNAAHNLTVNTTTNFYNDPNYGVAVNAGSITAANIDRHTALIDSWFTTGGTCVGRAGVLKSEDTDGSVGNEQNILANNAGGCFGLPINGAGSQDGMVASTATTHVTPNTLGLGLGNALLAALDQTTGNSVVITNGSIAALGGVVGPTASNRVLIGQFTTSGEFTFALNLQIINTSNNQAENYVASSPVGGELTHPSLTRTANTPPVVSITSPSNGSSHITGASVNIAATASDNGSVSSVAFFVDGNLISTDTTSPFTATYTAVLGAHVLTAVATDNDCTTTTSSSVNITVSNAPTGAPANDEITSASLISGSNSWYPQCQSYSGNLANANNSAQSVAVGPETWYRFVAVSPAVSIEMTGATMNNVIELIDQTGPTTYLVLNTENANPNVGAMERLNYNGLTIGDTYYVGCGSATAGPGGAFSVCIKQLLQSSCNSTVSAGLDICSTFKPKWTGASNYTVQFNPTFGSIGGGTTTNSGSFNLGSSTLNLVPGNTYDIIINANYVLTDNAPTPATENITVFGTNPTCASIPVNAHANVQVRSYQRCTAPATLLRGTVLRSDPFICGVTNYTFRFTPVVSCGDNTATGIPFTVTNTTRNISLSFASSLTTPAGQSIQSQTYYLVEIRPNFGVAGVNPGQFGTGQIIFVGGTAMDSSTTEEALLESEVNSFETTEAVVYPNPSNGQEVSIQVENFEGNKVTVEIMDQQGRIIFARDFTAENTLVTTVPFTQALANGIYNVRITTDSEILNERMLVQK